MRVKRSAKVLITNEARVLRQMRIAMDLSMRAAGALIGRSDTYISHIENGRMDVPTGPGLERLLAAYGGLKVKSFQERVRLYRQQLSPRDELVELAEHIGDAQVLTAVLVLRGMLAREAE